MDSRFQSRRDELMDAIEALSQVKAPAKVYRAALEEIKNDVEELFDAAIEAATDDVKRTGR